MKQEFIIDKRKIIIEAEITGIEGINDRFKFILDTGATVTVVDKSLARSLGFDLSKTETLQLATVGGRITANILKLPKISLFGKDVKNFEVNFVDLSPQITLLADGLIGFDFLSKFSEIKIDFKQKIIETF
jgi:clan AA aspartic protease (TIGR02281 family)